MAEATLDDVLAELRKITERLTRQDALAARAVAEMSKYRGTVNAMVQVDGKTIAAVVASENKRAKK